MSERKGFVTFKGNPVTLLGDAVHIGDKVPDLHLVATDMSEKAFHDYAGKVVIISVVPSLDTPVCDLQTKRFNEEAEQLGDDVVVLTVSLDLPFAQKRWCGATASNNIVALSDYKHRTFGEKFGLLIKELGLLARAVLILDRTGHVQYVQLVKEVAEEPNYGDVISHARKLL